MPYEYAVHRALREVQRILEVHPRRLPDNRAVALLREILSRRLVTEALACGSDSALLFVLRAVARIIADSAQPATMTLNHLRALLDQLRLEPLLQEVERRHFFLGWNRTTPN